MKKNKNLIILLLISVIGVAGFTVAYFSSTTVFDNIFQTPEYGTTYIEKFKSPDNWLPGDETEKTLEVTNSGNVDEAVRVKVEESWISKNNTSLQLKQGNNIAALINFINDEDWTKVEVDGEDYYYYYYNYKLAPGETTSKLLDKVTFNPLITSEARCTETVENGVTTRTCNSNEGGYDGATYTLTLTVETVQYNKYQDAWNIDVVIAPEKPEIVTLYNTIASEVGTRVTQYEGETTDGNGDKNVYYYVTGNGNNVLFAGYCWEIIRTTDTGGVKLIYNGLPDNDSKCGTDRGSNNVGYSSLTTTSLSSTYLYGTNFTYDKDNKVFILNDTQSIDPLTSDNYEDIIGKYTCKSTSDTCSTLYYVDSYSEGSTANVYILNNSTHYSLIGKSAYNSDNTNSLGSVGYMHNIHYPAKHVYPFLEKDITSITSLDANGYYASSYNYNGVHYSLVNPQKQTSDLPDRGGNYMLSFGYTFPNSYIYYLIKQKEKRSISYYAVTLSNNQSLSSANKTYKFGTSLIKNANNTYTISGTITSLTTFTWPDKKDLVKNLYTCGSDSLTCENPQKVVGIQLSEIGYRYHLVENIKYGKSFDYDSNTGIYTLTDTVSFYDVESNYTKLANYHYTCLNDSGSCTELSYIYGYNTSGYVYDSITLTVGDSIEDAINKVLNSNDVNKNNSTIKNVVDKWYELNLNKYANYLEDTVFCNDRRIKNAGMFNVNGGNLHANLLFIGENKVSPVNLSCSNDIDKFTVSSTIGNGSLKYPIGLATYPEKNLLISGSSNTSNYWWTSTPSYATPNGYNYTSSTSSSYIKQSINNSYGIRPVISLAPNTSYKSGNGSMDEPYYIATEFD